MTTPADIRRRRALLIAGGAAMLLVVAVAIGERHLKSTLEHAISARTGRQVRIGGELQTHLLSVHPTISAREVSIGNPTWMPPGVTAEISHVAVVLDWHWALPPFQIRRLEIDGADLHLVRDAQGRANWQAQEEGPGEGPPLVHSLSMPEARVELHDALRNLEFAGTVSAADGTAEGGAAPLRIEGAGQLNGRAASFRIRGDPLAEVRHSQPYHFKLEERSGATHLNGQGFFEHPFDFRQLQASFEIRGPNMADVYYVGGPKLPPTGEFALSGKLARSGSRFTYSDVRASSGESDIAGSVSVERVAGRARIEAQLTSARLRVADLGARASEPSAAATESQAPKTLKIPDTPLKIAGLRKSDAVVSFRARELDVGRFVLADVTGKLSLEDGVLSVAGVRAGFAGGALTGSASLDASRAVPRGSFDMVLTGSHLEQIKSAPAAMGGLSGELSARAQLSGSGTSLQGMASTAEGTVTAVIPRGTVRAALAEAASLELAGALGLMTKSQKETGVRCAVASFSAHAGVLSARTVIVDTDAALITMTGDAQIDTEALDFTVRGRPKTAALALHSGVAVGGTLAHPQLRLAGDHAAVQTGAAAALAVTLAPVAAVLAFVNPGLAHDADCEALLASGAAELPPKAAVASPPQ